MNYKLKKISGDASFREFYRVQKNTKSSIIILAKKDKYKNLTVYSAVNEILNKNKILAPKLINNFIKKDIIEISDLGKISFFNYVKNKKNKTKDYKKLIDLIVKLQKIKLKQKYKFLNKIVNFKKYSVNELHKESDLFFDWYLRSFIKKKKLSILKLKIKNELTYLYKMLHFKNLYFTHRDFHASNIMISRNKLGLIDNQDAIIGNPMYDVASLIDDVRIQIPQKTKSDLFKYYILKSKFKKEDHLNLRNDFDILSVQRNLKILGIFVRLYKRDKKPNYLKYLPYTWKLIKTRLRNPIFKNLKSILDINLSIKKLKKVKFK